MYEDLGNNRAVTDFHQNKTVFETANNYNNYENDLEIAINASTK